MKRKKRSMLFILFLLYCNFCLQCNGETMKAAESRTKVERVMLSILLGTITGMACALFSALLLRFIFQHMKKVPILKGPVVFSPEISPKSLQSALANLELIKGKYYKTQLLDNGVTVAVKKLETTTEAQIRKRVKRRIQKELEILAGLKNRHLMSLRAAYVGDEASADYRRFCLVYDYVPTGSLEDEMKRNGGVLQIGWDARLRIAVGIVKGLQYLHFTCTPRILHFNLKPSNVLLDAEFEPRLGDCGLPHTFNGIRSSPSEEENFCYYYAPECFPNFSIYTEKSDVFSFGVILGMLLTGRDPSDPLFSGGMGMGMWLRQVVEAGDGREALDKSLLRGEEMEEDEMLMAVRIAAVCLSDMPADRPSSDELVPMLTQLHSF